MFKFCTTRSKVVKLNNLCIIFFVVAVSVESGVKVRQEVKIYKGKSVELICKITGYPAATVTWMKKDKPITGIYIYIYIFKCLNFSSR